MLSSFGNYYYLFKADNSFLAKKPSIFERNNLYNKIEPSISSLRWVKLSIFKSYIKFAQANDLVNKRLNIAAGVATKYLWNYLGCFFFLDTNINTNRNNMLKATLSENIANSNIMLTNCSSILIWFKSIIY